MSFESEIKKQFSEFKSSISSIRIDVLEPEIFSKLKINNIPLKSLSHISNLDRKTVQIIVWDNSNISSIQKEIIIKFPNYSVTSNNNTIFVSMPNLSEEYRNDLQKEIKHLSEQSKISMRLLRQKFNKKAEKMNNPTSIKNKNQDILNDYCSRIESEMKRKLSQF